MNETYNNLYWVACPTREDDLNWIPWLLIGHFSQQLLTKQVLETFITEAINAWKEANPTWYEIYDEDDEAVFEVIATHLENNGYVVVKSNLNWGLVSASYLDSVGA